MPYCRGEIRTRASHIVVVSSLAALFPMPLKATMQPQTLLLDFGMALRQIDRTGRKCARRCAPATCPPTTGLRGHLGAGRRGQPNDQRDERVVRKTTITHGKGRHAICPALQAGCFSCWEKRFPPPGRLPSFSGVGHRRRKNGSTHTNPVKRRLTRPFRNFPLLIDRPPFGLQIGLAQILAQNADAKQLDAAQQQMMQMVAGKPATRSPQMMVLKRTGSEQRPSRQNSTPTGNRQRQGWKSR